MKISDRVRLLYEKDTKSGYVNLQTLETLSESEDILYPYLGEFIVMLNSEQRSIRVRGFRLLCRQAKWDSDNKINEAIGNILEILNDEKPTVIRQALQHLKYIVPHKKELNDNIRGAVLSVDHSQFKDTMRPLIAKDIRDLLQLIDKQ